MDVTRAGRASRPVRKTVAAPASGQAEPKTADPLFLPLERCVLVIHVLGRERAWELLDGLVAAEAERARGLLTEVAQLPSARRQARLSLAFGEREGAADRLRAVMASASGCLRKALYRALPPYHRSLFPGQALEASSPGDAPGMEALAARLIREATR
ncbi:hypothetical protein DRW03_04535 [Corallococcus sp. H22C18031201]|nr:hypothetical protein DRW03_04535 [Corallococcus sp. H22C18031201]